MKIIIKLLIIGMTTAGFAGNPYVSKANQYDSTASVGTTKIKLKLREPKTPENPTGGAKVLKWVATSINCHPKQSGVWSENEPTLTGGRCTQENKVHLERKVIMPSQCGSGYRTADTTLKCLAR